MGVLVLNNWVRLNGCLIIVVLLVSTNSLADEFLLGVNTHFGQIRGNIPKSLEASRELGINSIRDELYWEGMECCEKGKLWVPRAWAGWAKTLDKASELRVEPLIILGFGHRFHDGGAFPKSPEARRAFVKYVDFTARRFAGQVQMYEIWNEWNLGAGDKTRKGRGDPVVYFELLSDVYKKIKQIAPSTIVLGGAVAGMDREWIEELMKLGGLKYMDGLSIHPYNYCALPIDRKPENVFEMLRTLEERLLKYSDGKEIPIYVSEIGWSTYSGECKVSEADASNYLARFFLGIRLLPFIKGAWWYDLQNDGTVPSNKEHNFGLITTSYRRKPSFYAMKDIARLVKESDQVVQESKEKEVWALRFSERKAAVGLAIWSSARRFAWNASLRNNGNATANISVKDVGETSSAVAHHIPPGDSIFLEVSERPVLISGNIREVEVFLIQGAKKSGLVTNSKPDNKDKSEKSNVASPIEE